jgi:hypothetical protein
LNAAGVSSVDYLNLKNQLMKTFLIAVLAFVGFALCAPEAQARHYTRYSHGHSHYYGRPAYGRAYYGRPAYGHAYYGRSHYYHGYYRPYYYYPRARYYSGGYYNGCSYPGYYGYGYGPRISLSFGF